MAKIIALRIAENEKELLRETRARARQKYRLQRELDELKRRGFPTGCRDGLSDSLRASLKLLVREIAWRRGLVAEAVRRAEAMAD